MMEVNHKTTLEFGDLMTNTNNSTDRISNEDIQDNVDNVELVSTLKTSLLKDKNIKENDSLTNGLLADINGTDEDPTSVDICVNDLDLEDAQITPELEDKLLADDDTDVVDKLLAEVVPSTILNNSTKRDDVKDTVPIEENVQTDNGETLRNPGDDLDTLLSKINDIVDDCVEPEKVKSTEADLISFDTTIKNKNLDEKCPNEIDESVILLDESAIEVSDNDANKMEEDEICENSLNKTVTATDETATANQEIIKEPKPLNINDESVTASKENLQESKSLTASAINQENKEQTNEPMAIDDKECSVQDDKKITESDQMILDVDLDDFKSSASQANEKQDCVTDMETNEEETNHIVENVDAKEDLDKDDTKSELEDKTKCDDGSSILNENEVTNKAESAISNKTPESTPVISLDADDSDDDIVFFCENSKNSMDGKETKESESEQNEQAQSKTDDESKVKDMNTKEEESNNNIDDDDDDVVLLDDDDEDDVPTKPVQESNNEEADADLKPEVKTDDTSENAEKKEEIESTTDVQKETVETKQIISKEDTSKETDKMLIDDNSDNAKDKFDALANDKKLDALGTAGADAEETNSNCSSSSNLLQEAKAVSEEGEEETDLGNEDEEDVAENESETAGTEVDILEGELAEEDSKESAPPAKRIRLSTDDDRDNNIKSTEEPAKIIEDKKENLEDIKIDNETKSDAIENELEHKINEADIKSDTDKIAIKRSLDSLDSDEKTEQESVTKKIKTDELPVDEPLEKQEPTQDDKKFDVIEIPDGKDDDDDDEVKPTKVTEETAAINDVSEEIKEEAPIVKAVPSHVPIPLYPPPQFQESPAELNLDFLKRFKKSLVQMTKIDLEELILQKIVEAVIHKSEFGEMRELIEKQEKIIATHRTKITELSKQFRDLEMVHNRVLKDIEVKNSQFLMPVKITRAVGLQVFIPHKKNVESAPSTASTSNASTSSTSNVQQSAQNQYRPISNSSSQLTSPSRQIINDTASSSRLPSTVLPTTAATAAANARRGCVQKVTPQRPVDVGTSQQTTSTYRTPQTQQSLVQQNPTKLLNKSVSSAPAQIRNRYSGPASIVQQQQQQQQQQLARQQPSPTNPVRKISPAPNSAMAKQHNSNAMSQQYRRPDSTQQSTSSPATVPENYMSSIHQIPPGVPAVSITPAKPKEKSVIDLTDEDDVPSSTATATTSTAPTAIRRPPNNSNTSGGSSSYVLNKMSSNAARLPPNQSNKAQTTARQQLASIMYGGSKTNGNSSATANIPGVSTPPGTSITRIQLGTRKPTYSHPAPLPPTPAQNLNPAWKLPPPRPTIRISNLDNGIVISWTVEEAMDRHADCVSYQIYAYQETSGPPLIDSWRHVGDVKAMLLPMAVTLTQFQEGQRYYFAVRAVDVHHRVGPFSLPKTWS